MPWIQDVLTIKDGAGIQRQIPVLTDGTNFLFGHILYDEAGGLISPAVKTGSVLKSVQPTVTATSAYTSGNCVGGLLTIPNAVRVNSGSGLIQHADVWTKSAQTGGFDVVYFQTVPTSTLANKTAYNLNQLTDIPYVVGTAHCTDVISHGTPTQFQAPNLAIPFKISANDQNLYAQIVARGTPTFGLATDVFLNTKIMQD